MQQTLYVLTYRLQDCSFPVNLNEIEPLWFEGDQTPLNIEDITFSGYTTEDKECIELWRNLMEDFYNK